VPETPLYADVSKAGLTQTLRALKQSGVKSVFIDTPPFATIEIAAIIRMASLIIVPVVPSPHDLRAIGETIALVLLRQKLVSSG